MQLYASYADAMIAAARRAKQDIAFVWEPALIHSEGSKPLSDEERSLVKSLDQTPEKAAQFEASRQAFHALLDGAGVPVVDPTDAFKTTPETVFIDYVHYTPDGNRFIASIVYKQLRALLAAKVKDKK
jgi:lysophospholipase L1-like esterase